MRLLNLLKKGTILATFTLMANFGFGQSAVVTLRPTHIDLTSATNESAVLMTLSGYSQDDARYKLYNGTTQHYCWDPATSQFITATAYSSNPLIPGTPTTSTTFWIPFQIGTNPLTAASYRDRLGPSYATPNYQTVALPAATAITTPVIIDNADITFTTWNTYAAKYVILGYDQIVGGTLIAATSSAITTGAFSLIIPDGIAIKRIEVRTLLNALVEEVTGTWPASNSVFSPIITPGTSTFYNPYSVNVSITSGTEDALIYYTIDGSDPDESSTLYEGSFSISETTTVKAKAYKAGLDASTITTSTLTFVDPDGYAFDIAELRGKTADATSVYYLYSEAVLVYGRVARNQKYVQDATASILIDDNDNIIKTEYNVGDGISGIAGKLSLFNGMLQFVPVQDPGAATSTGNAIVIEDKTLASLTEADQAKLIRVSDVTFADYEGGTGVFTIAQDFPISDPSKGTAKFRTTFSEADYINQPLPLVSLELVAFVNYDATAGFRLTARNSDDFTFTGINDIINFTFPESVSTVINSEEGTVIVKVITNTDLSLLTPTITISAGATIDPASGVAQNFTSAVVYTVTAANGVDQKVWNVIVSHEDLVHIFDIQYTTATPADSPYKDQIVATSGIVTAYHYAWSGETQNYLGYFIQNGTGAWNGIRVFNSSTTNRPNIGDLVRIKGTVRENFENTQIESITNENVILSTGNSLPAVSVTTTLDASSEKWEGVLIKVENANCTNADAGFGMAAVNDGSGQLLVDDDIYKHTFTTGSNYNVTGIGYYSYDAYKILPRSAADVTLATSTPTNDWRNSISTYPNPFSSAITIDNVSSVSRISVSNLIGQQVISVKLNGENRIELSTENFAQGIYLITIENAKGEKVVRKMVKK